MVSRERLHDEMAVPSRSATSDGCRNHGHMVADKANWMISGDCLPAAIQEAYLELLTRCVRLAFIAAIATSVAMHVDMGDNGHLWVGPSTEPSRRQF